MKDDNTAPKPVEQEVGQMAVLEQNKKDLSSRKVSFTAYSKIGRSEKVCAGKSGLATA